jgi:hypothetical protein
MSNVVPFDQFIQKPDEDSLRWKIVLIYPGVNGEFERRMVQLEELAELQDIVEHGPDWNELVIGTITLQRRWRRSLLEPQNSCSRRDNRLHRGKIVFARRETHNIEAKPDDP